MAELTVPQIDFSAIGQLPQLYRQGRDDAATQMALSQLGQNPQADANTLIGSRNLPLAQLGITMRNHQEDQVRQAQQDAHQLARDKVSDQHWGASYALQKAGADRAAYEFEHTPDQLVPNPRANEPGQPAYIDQYEQAKAANLAPPVGFQRGENGALTFVPGGPRDPETIAREAEAKQGSGMGDAAVELAARRLKEGDLSALTNIGRGAQASRDLGRIQNRMADILVKEDGLSSADAAKAVSTSVQSFKASQTGQNAEARTGATREANLNLILKATDAAIPAALEASDRVARSGWVPLNNIIQKGEVVASNPDLKRFGMANLQLAEHWARAMNPTGVMRESDRDKALGFLSTADSPTTYRAAVDQLRTQITRERDAVRSSIPATPQFKAGPNTAPATPSQGNGADVMRSHAKDAIAQGAPRDVVIKRLQDAGIDPSGI